MKELKLKYGCNPNQNPANLTMPDGSELPFEVLNGNPGYTLSPLFLLEVWSDISPSASQALQMQQCSV